MVGDRSSPDRYFEARITIPFKIHDIISAYIMECFGNGIVLDEHPDTETVTLTFYVPRDQGMGFREQLTAYINHLQAMPPIRPNALRIEDVSSYDWETAFHDVIKPVEICGIVIKPP